MADKFIGVALYTKTHRADEDLEAGRFVKLVTATGSQPHVVYADAEEAPCGVTRDAYKSAQYADVVKIGDAYVLASENITAGQHVNSDLDGQAKPTDDTELSCGQAQTDANAGEFVLVLLAIS